MKKHITIEFDDSWIELHRYDDELPTMIFRRELQKFGIYEIIAGNLTMLVIGVDKQSFDKAIIESQIVEIFNSYYPGTNITQVITLTLGSPSQKNLGLRMEETVESEGEKADDSAIHSGHKLTMDNLGDKRDTTQRKQQKFEAPVQILLDEINNLVGAVEFKSLAEEIATIAPQIRAQKTFDVFTQQNYLFSIGDGCGLSTYLQQLAKLIYVTQLRPMFNRPIIEGKLAPYKESMEPFEEVMDVLSRGDENATRILCVDISEWLDKTDNRFFKEFLKNVAKHQEEFILVFRVPFLEKDVLERTKLSLNDLLCVRAVSIPPFSHEEIQLCAEREFEKHGFSVAKSAWRWFMTRIAEEKNDGRIYGLNTVKKVVRETIYNKHLTNAQKGKSETVISAADAKNICRGLGSTLSGEEQLNALIGNTEVKAKIQEIIAQIEVAIKNESSERPCIHMRFLGNPGTGKTTVARIIGKILKERGVLRVGNFYEVAGRDFCGRYIGETAPKTASICRDAYGSVLFIDEAYSLYRGDDNDRDFGREAIDTLIAEMENHRDDFVVIMAGYTDDMEKLMRGNQGLASRMPYIVEFPNFTRLELYEIFVSMVNAKFKYDDKLFETAKNYFDTLSDELFNSKEFSNARYVRNLFERTWAKAAMRCQLTGNKEVLLTKEDFERASGEKEFAYTAKKTRIGF